MSGDAMEVDAPAAAAAAAASSGSASVRDSRLEYAVGRDVLLKMKDSSVLVVGMRGLGAEVAKNVVLMGVRAVTLHDDGAAALADLSAQFFLTEADVGQPRAQASLARVQDLNRTVHVSVHSGELSEDVVRQFRVVVCTENTSHARWLALGDFCHRSGIHFVSCDLYGLAARVFVDFGDAFVVTDATGEQPLSAHIESVSQGHEGVVRVLDDQRHGFESGTYVRFREVRGMTELNGRDPVPIKVTGPYTFVIDDTSAFADYAGGGIVEEVKVPRTVHFETLSASARAPAYVPSDFAKMERQGQLHVGAQALQRFADVHGRAPRMHDAADTAAVLAEARALNDALKAVEALDDKLLAAFVEQHNVHLSPLAALLGGFVGQEVMKAISGKFTPLQQWMYFDAFEALPAGLPLAEFEPSGTRLDGQIAVFGRTLQGRLCNARVFVVGAGAIGCELLKNLALMGVGCGARGEIIVTDMDTIEISNLNRQFLFREKDVQRLKSEVAAEAVQRMVPGVKIRAFQDKVGPDTEETFDDAFWQGVDCVCNALDNVQARLYVDERCRFYARPLLESGTLGTKGNVQVVVPFLTETYGNSRDPPEKETPMCTIKNFPYEINHTIHWAREQFETLFSTAPRDANAYATSAAFLPELMRQPGHQATLEMLRESLCEAPRTMEDCIVWARHKFDQLFTNTIRQLLFTFPPDMVTSSGAPFWSGTKRCPTPVVFDAADPLHLEFVRAAANLRASVYGIAQTSVEAPVAPFARVAATIPPVQFVPKVGLKIQTNEKENVPETASDDNSVVEALLAALPPRDTLGSVRLQQVEFEKDSDDNWHVQFMTAASNCRAAAYGIAPADLQETRRIAGRIIPAIVTTTAVVTGLVCVELVKYMEELRTLEPYKNAFVNLALPFFGFSEPIAVPKNKVGGHEFTMWNFIDIKEGRDITVRELMAWFEHKYQWTVTMVSCGVSLLYLSWWPADKRETRANMPITEIVSSVTKQPVPAKKSCIMLQVCCDDKDGEELEIPDVRYFYR